MTPDEHLTKLFKRIDQLEKIILDQGMLGLSQGRQFIYVQKQKQSLWAFIATDEPVNATSITGYIQDIYRKEDDVPKLHIVLRTGDAEYVLCSGFETHFSRDVMAVIAQLRPEQLKRPLKVVPTVKEKPGKKQDKHQPVYANVLLDGQTIRTFQLKKEFSAEDLFKKAIAVFKDGKTMPSQNSTSKAHSPKVTTRFDRVHVSASPRTESRDYVRCSKTDRKSSQRPKPPALDEEPPIASMKEIDSTAASLGSDEATDLKVESVDWKAFCQKHNILPGVLKALAQELSLPMGKLNPSQSATLYKAAWERFVATKTVS